MRRSLLVLFGAAVAALAVSSGALSGTDPITVDRGLPTANLNNAAAGNRSNVAWSQGNDAITGDTFSVGSAGQTWIVTGIRTWNIGHLGMAFGDEFSADTLYFGTGAVSEVESGTVATGSDTDSNPSITHTRVKYADGSNYQAQDGSYRQIWQNDFTNLDLTVNGGQTYYFAVDGTTSSYYWFNHASNAALAGSPQQGADGKYYTWSKSDLSTPTQCDSNGQINGCDGGWDKSSDIDVQVFAHQVATNPGSCKSGGWKDEVRDDGTSFRNQGACVSYGQHHNGLGEDDQHAHDGNAGNATSGDSAATHGDHGRHNGNGKH